MDEVIETVKFNTGLFQKRLSDIGIGSKIVRDEKSGKLVVLMYQHGDGRETGLVVIE